MKTLVRSLLAFLIGVSLISCNGKTTTPKGKQNTESKVQIENLYKISITGDKVENGLDETFIQAVINDVISRRISYFYNLSILYFFEQGMGNDTELPMGFRIKNIIRSKYKAPVSRLKSSTELLFDINGVIKSHKETDYHYNNGVETKSSSIDNFQVEYVSENPIKFKSITILNTPDDGVRDPEEIKKLSFSYDDSGILQSIVTSYKSKELEHIRFSYYRNGVMAGTDFYSFMEANPSTPKEYYSNGTLFYKRTMDSDGNTYIIDTHSHANREDTIRIYDNNNSLICFGEGSVANSTHFYPEFNVMGNSGIRTLYTKFDDRGNWINAELYYDSKKEVQSKFEREISYY